LLGFSTIGANIDLAFSYLCPMDGELIILTDDDFELEEGEKGWG
jgi:hypothetical protein